MEERKKSEGSHFLCTKPHHVLFFTQAREERAPVVLLANNFPPPTFSLYNVPSRRNPANPSFSLPPWAAAPRSPLFFFLVLFSVSLHRAHHCHHLDGAPSPWLTSSQAKTVNSSVVSYLFSRSSHTCWDAFKPPNCRRLPHGSLLKFAASDNPPSSPAPSLASW
jgi:hypothetical protein